MNLPRQKLQKNHCHFKLNVYYVHVSFGGFFHTHKYSCTCIYVHRTCTYYDTGRGQHMGKSEKNSRLLPFKVHLIIFEL